MGLILNRIFICVLMLSINGLIFSSIYLILEKILYKATSARFMMFMNIFALFSFVLPIFYIVSIFEGTEIVVFQGWSVTIIDGASLFDTFAAHIHRTYDFIKYADDVWFIGVVIFLVIKTISYIMAVKKIKAVSFPLENRRWLTIFENIKNANISENIELLESTCMGIPFTTGINKKIIVIPSVIIDVFDDDEIEFILRHELYHAEKNHVGIKLLIIILNSLNWFNPMYYFLKRNLSNWMELSCDESVTENMDMQYRKKYSGLIVKTLEIENQYRKINPYCLCYGGNAIKNYKKRILMILNSKNKKVLWEKYVILIGAVIIMVFSNAVAKEADVYVNKLFAKNIDVDDINNIQFVPLSENNITDDRYSQFY